jgi:hypothetical protein
MKKAIIFLFGVLLLGSCNKDKLPANGSLAGTVKYTGASDMAMDNVIITLHPKGENAEKGSWRIEKSGKYSFDLPAGEYELKLEGNRCVSKDLPATVKINAGKPTSKDINIEQLPSSMVILRNDIEIANGNTISLANGDVLDIWNKYSNNTLKWEIRAYPADWILFEDKSDTITGGGRKPVVFSIDRDKLPAYGYNYADIILTTNDNGSFKITVVTFKESSAPAKAAIAGSSANTCPAASVVLTASAEKATSYIWYKGNNIIGGVSGNTCEVTQSDIYYAVGVNNYGDGTKSNGKSVSIKDCPIVPAQATITSNSTNTCPAASVTLTANAAGATSYKWYRDNTVLYSATGNTYEATQNGTYYVMGINAIGDGLKSDGKTITINTCPALPASATISGNSTNSCSGANGLTVTLTASATRATSYIWRKGNEQLNETGNTLTVRETGTYYVKGVNESGAGQESAGKAVSITSCVPASPTNIDIYNSSFISLMENKIELSWSDVPFATQYKIQVCDNPAMTGCEHNYYTTTSSDRYFSYNDLPCGKKYFRISAVNSFGESAGTPFSYTMPVSIATTTSLSLTYSSKQAYTLGYIGADVTWYEGTIYFEIQRKEDNGTWQVIATITGNTNENIWHSYQDFSYSKDAEYLEYRVRAYIKTSCGIMEDYAY